MNILHKIPFGIFWLAFALSIIRLIRSPCFMYSLYIDIRGLGHSQTGRLS